MKQLTTYLFALGVATTAVSASSEDFLIHSFENNDLTSPTAITLQSGNIASSEFSTDEATEGVASYKVTPTVAAAGDGARLLLTIDLLSHPDIFDALAINPEISFDVIIPVDDNPSDGSFGSGMNWVYNSTATGFQVGSYYISGSYTGYGGGTNTINFTLSEAAIAGLSDAANYEEGGFAELTIGVTSDPGVQPTAYFDNIRIANVPEPASLALLGLGGLMLIRRR